jgi:hypothetical protein
MLSKMSARGKSVFKDSHRRLDNALVSITETKATFNLTRINPISQLPTTQVTIAPLHESYILKALIAP